MRRATVLVLWVAFVLLGMLTISSGVGANAAYNEAERWFSYATYEAECGPGGPSEGRPGCEALRAESPAWPSGVPITDRDLLLSNAAAMHSTGTAILSITGMLIAAATLCFSLAVFAGAERSSGSGLA